MPTVKVKKLHPQAILPRLAIDGAAGYDLATCYTFTLPARSRLIISLGLALAIPPNYSASIRSRSGLMFKQGVFCFHGLIDSSYRGEVKLLLVNSSDEDVTFNEGDRVAQMTVDHVPPTVFTLVEELPDNVQNHTGFGSTGLATLPVEEASQ
jgi:dUTP pyrophosphatase